jgi:drug/metabolite transporter (DMT)-like permease
MTASSHRLKGVLLTAIGVLVLTPDAVLIRLIQCDPWTLLFWRGLLQCAALMLGYLVVYRRDAVATFSSVGWFGLLVGISYAAGNILFIHSIRTTSVANTLLIISASPLIAAIYSRLFLREKTKWYTWAAAIISLLGVAIIFSGSRISGGGWGDVLAFVAACCMAGSFVLIRAARLSNMIPAVAISGLVIALAVASFAPTLSVTPRDMAYLLVLGGFIIPIAFALITLGPRYISASEVSLLMLIETVLGPTWVWLVLGEQPSPTTYAGGAVVLGALIAHSVISLRRG